MNNSENVNDHDNDNGNENENNDGNSHNDGTIIIIIIIIIITKIFYDRFRRLPCGSQRTKVLALVLEKLLKNIRSPTL